MSFESFIMRVSMTHPFQAIFGPAPEERSAPQEEGEVSAWIEQVQRVPEFLENKRKSREQKFLNVQTKIQDLQRFHPERVETSRVKLHVLRVRNERRDDVEFTVSTEEGRLKLIFQTMPEIDEGLDAISRELDDLAFSMKDLALGFPPREVFRAPEGLEIRSLRTIPRRVQQVVSDTLKPLLERKCFPYVQEMAEVASRIGQRAEALLQQPSRGDVVRLSRCMDGEEVAALAVRTFFDLSTPQNELPKTIDTFAPWIHFLGELKAASSAPRICSLLTPTVSAIEGTFRKREREIQEFCQEDEFAKKAYQRLNFGQRIANMIQERRDAFARLFPSFQRNIGSSYSSHASEFFLFQYASIQAPLVTRLQLEIQAFQSSCGSFCVPLAALLEPLLEGVQEEKRALARAVLAHGLKLPKGAKRAEEIRLTSSFLRLVAFANDFKKIVPLPERGQEDQSFCRLYEGERVQREQRWSAFVRSFRHLPLTMTDKRGNGRIRHFGTGAFHKEAPGSYELASIRVFKPPEVHLKPLDSYSVPGFLYTWTPSFSADSARSLLARLNYLAQRGVPHILHPRYVTFQVDQSGGREEGLFLKGRVIDCLAASWVYESLSTVQKVRLILQFAETFSGLHRLHHSLYNCKKSHIMIIQETDGSLGIGIYRVHTLLILGSGYSYMESPIQEGHLAPEQLESVSRGGKVLITPQSEMFVFASLLLDVKFGGEALVGGANYFSSVATPQVQCPDQICTPRTLSVKYEELKQKIERVQRLASAPERDDIDRLLARAFSLSPDMRPSFEESIRICQAWLAREGGHS